VGPLGPIGSQYRAGLAFSLASLLERICPS
jgi:hypothetical protein